MPFSPYLGRLSAIVALSIGGAFASQSAAMTPDPEKTARICAEAEDRYQELFGKPSTEEEGVTIVTMYKYTYCPLDLSVAAGTTVRWVNVEKRTSHSVWFRDLGEPESERMFTSESHEMIFPEPGEFKYLCGPHWDSHDMIGTVTVTP